MGETQSKPSTPCDGKNMWRASSTEKGKGKRDKKNDKDCSKKIPSEEAGYCDCKQGPYYYNSGHEPLRCAVACKGPRPHQIDETRNIVAEWESLKLDNKQADVATTARDQQNQKFLIAVVVLIGAYILFFRGSNKKSAKELYLERMKEDGIL